MTDNPVPLEEEDPELGELLAWAANENARRMKAGVKRNKLIRVDFEKGKVKDPSAPRPTVVGRNEPCPCGSGKKFKKCCINKGG